MVKSNSTSRLFSLNTQIVLTQTDTTVGFLSQNNVALASIKIRPNTKPFIKVYRSLKNLKQEHKRVPNKFKKDIRLSTQTTFIVKDEAFRIAAYPVQSNILRNLQWSYSTSANESGKNFNREFCQSKTDIIIEDRNPLEEKRASKLLKINNKKIKRLR
jgi:tRNA A37 threonylcarbamoyladenosine synthetase subunit TsaC/SUA5/YrdC